MEGQQILRAPPAPPLDVPCKITSKSNRGLLQYFIYSQCKKYSDITHSTLHGRSITSARILKQWKFIASLLRWNLLLQFPLHIERLEHELNLHNSTAIGNINTVSLVLICPLELQSSNHWLYKWCSIPCEVCRGCWIHVLCVDVPLAFIKFRCLIKKKTGLSDSERCAFSEVIWMTPTFACACRTHAFSVSLP